MRLEEGLLTVVGGKTAKPLAEKLGLHTVSDLLRHYPRRYKDSKNTDLSDLVVGEHATAIAEVRSFNDIPMRQRKGSRQEVVIQDILGNTCTLAFFMQGWRKRDLTPGQWIVVSGDVSEFRGKLQLAHPDYVLVKRGDESIPPILPVYPATTEVRSWAIFESMRLVLPPNVQLGGDPLPEALRDKYDLINQDAALEGIHTPSTWAHLGVAKKRLKWDEAFALQVALAQRRRAATQIETSARPGRDGGLLDAFMRRLPFELTSEQRQVTAEIATELGAGHPMHRLLQGEVGSGKTVVALIAMLMVIDSGGQAALLAPTEVLAMQHYRSITAMLGPLAQAGMLGGAEDATKVALLTGSMGARAKQAAMLDAQSGEAGIVIGTHALIEDRVGFADLGLVVVDEQHRFGVKQRDALRTKSASPPHVLVMTATPIPRTIAMTVFGDLETSTLRELPGGRRPITSHVVPEHNEQWMQRMWERIHEEVAKGHQAYVVFPRIGEGGLEDATDLESEEEKRPPLALLEYEGILREHDLAGLRVGVLHGRMNAEAKDAMMTAFSRGELDVLLATTVIEVGVDVPNATVMVVMDSDRFGISQLHQLRGRVGRGEAASLCFLHTAASPESPAWERVNAVASTSDGFELARVDLELRKEGDILGERQSGMVKRLRLLSLTQDEDLIAEAREEALAFVEHDPDIATNESLAALVRSLVDDEAAEFLERG